MLRCKEDTFYIGTTRFNDDTYAENVRYRQRCKFDGCIYGVPKPVAVSVPHLAKMFVLEMNNTTEEIEGVGYIRNQIARKRRHVIYSDQNYNRFSYISKHRVDRSEMNDEQMKLLSLLEAIVFRSKGHLKRGHGITCVPQSKVDLIQKPLLAFFVSLFIREERQKEREDIMKEHKEEKDDETEEVLEEEEYV